MHLPSQSRRRVRKLLNLEEDTIEVTTDEIIPMETAEMIADSLQHELYKGGYYTMKQKSEALEECVEANVTIEQL